MRGEGAISGSAFSVQSPPLRITGPSLESPIWAGATRIQEQLAAKPAHPVLWLLLPMLVAISVRFFFAPTDYDYWWHARTGQLIAETGGLPRADAFSYTAEGNPWVTHEWLTQIIFHVVQQQLGYVGNVVLFGLIGGLTWLAVYATCRLRGLGEPGAVVLVMWGSAMAASTTAVRPQAITALLLAVCALTITRYKRGDTRALWMLPPLFLLWVNLHGGYVIGLVLLGLAIVGDTISVVLRHLSTPAEDSTPNPHAGQTPLTRLIAIAALCGLATLVSPHGLDGLAYPFSYAGTSNASMRFISEWQSPDFHDPTFLIFGASLLLAVLLGIARKPLGATEALWGLLFAFMALSSLRHIALYAIIATPLLAARLATTIPWLSQPLSAWRRPLLVAVAWPLLIASLMMQVARAEPGGGAQLSREPGTAQYPAGAVDYLKQQDMVGNLFNEYHWGGYLIYQLYPDRRVFIDGRPDMYGDRFVERYLQVALLRPTWSEVLDEHDVRLVLIDRANPLALLLRPEEGWQEVYSGPVERLFARPALPESVP